MSGGWHCCRKCLFFLFCFAFALGANSHYAATNWHTHTKTHIFTRNQAQWIKTHTHKRMHASFSKRFQLPISTSQFEVQDRRSCKIQLNQYIHRVFVLLLFFSLNLREQCCYKVIHEFTRRFKKKKRKKIFRSEIINRIRASDITFYIKHTIFILFNWVYFFLPSI